PARAGARQAPDGGRRVREPARPRPDQEGRDGRRGDRGEPEARAVSDRSALPLHDGPSDRDARRAAREPPARRPPRPREPRGREDLQHLHAVSRDRALRPRAPARPARARSPRGLGPLQLPEHPGGVGVDPARDEAPHRGPRFPAHVPRRQLREPVPENPVAGGRARPAVRPDRALPGAGDGRPLSDRVEDREASRPVRATGLRRAVRSRASPAAVLVPTSTNLRTRILPVENGRERLGWVAIDSTVCGRARGGLRLVADLESDEVSDAARCMTLKYGLLGLPQGGAKAGVRGDPDAPRAERRARLLEFGRAIEPLLRARSYVPDADLGTDASDIRWMAESLGLRVGAREWRASHSGVWTAHSVLAAMRAGLRRSGRELRGATVAIEGFGAVGSALAGLAHAAGARVVAVSTSRGALFDARGLDVPSLV